MPAKIVNGPFCYRSYNPESQFTEFPQVVRECDLLCRDYESRIDKGMSAPAYKYVCLIMAFTVYSRLDCEKRWDCVIVTVTYIRSWYTLDKSNYSDAANLNGKFGFNKIIQRITYEPTVSLFMPNNGFDMHLHDTGAG